MNQIKLSVDDKNLDIVLNILNNLKNGLIANIKTDTDIKTKIRATQYQLRNNKIIRKENSGTNDSSGKYINISAYKQKLKKMKKND
ncbi:MAG: hypothetical protein L3J10_09270 [Sulfurimonas sp.]|nr:hypothetical protein [Sulfurimonas sp.]